MPSDIKRQVRGIFVTPAGEPVTNKTLTFFRSRRVVTPAGDSTVVDEPFFATTDGTGLLDKEMLAGNYMVMVKLSDVDRYFNMAVPDEPGPHNPVDLLDYADPGEPVLTQVQQLILKARAWAENPEDVLVDPVGYPGEYSAKHWAAKAEDAAGEIKDVSAQANTLPAGDDATASYDEATGVLSFGIPRGEKGDKGDKGDKGNKGDKGDDWPDAPADGKIYGRENGGYSEAAGKKYVDDRIAEGVRTLRSFGAVGDATQDSGGGNFAGTDDTAAIQSACTWMTGAKGRILDGEGRQYLLTDTVSGIGSFRIVGKPKFLKSTDGPAFDFRPACYGPVKLASNYTKGGTNLSLASGIPAGFRQGTPMKIVSDAVDGANRDKGSAALQYRTGEWFLSQSGSTSTSLNLQAPLRFTEGIDPTSVAGEESEIDAYTTAMNARIVFPDPYAICDCDIIVSAQNVGAVWSGDLVRLFGYVRPIIRLAVERAYGPGLSVCAYEGSVIDMSVENCADNPGNGQYGYGIANAGSYGLTVRGLKGANCRHVYSSSVGRLEADSGAHWQLLGVGRTVGGDISGKGYGGSNAIWDTHHSSQDETFHEIYAEGGDLWAMNVRGRGVDVRGLKSRNCHSGFIALTEYESGDTDDDLFTAGKGAQWFTSCRLIDADLDTHTGEVLNNSHAFFDVGGTGRYRSNQHVFLNQSGGITRITGNHYIKVSGTPVGSGSDGIFTIYAPNANADEAFPDGAICYIDGNVEIDARDAIDDIDAFDIATGARLIVRGFLKILVPDEGSSYSRNSVYPEVEGSGVIEYWEGDTLAEAHYAPVKAFKSDTAAKILFDGCAVGGAEIYIEDDAVFEIKPPRGGGFLLVTGKGEGSFPQGPSSSLFWFDVGSSNQLVRLDPASWAGTTSTFGTKTAVSAVDLTGTTGVDGDLTVRAKDDGKLQFENRTGEPLPVNLTFL